MSVLNALTRMQAMNEAGAQQGMSTLSAIAQREKMSRAMQGLTSRLGGMPLDQLPGALLQAGLPPEYAKQIFDMVAASRPEQKDPVFGTAKPGDIITMNGVPFMQAGDPPEDPPWPGAIRGADGQWVTHPNRLRELMDMKSAGKPETTVNVGTGDTEYDKSMGKFNAETYQGMLSTAQNAALNNTRLARAKGIVQNIKTGAMQPTVAIAKKLASDLGLPVDMTGIPESEALQAVTIDLTMDMVQRTKGAVSNTEMKLFEKSAPQLANTNAGNLMIIAMAEILNNNAIEVSKLARDYVKNNGRFDEFFQDNLVDFYKNNSLFSPPAIRAMMADVLREQGDKYAGQIKSARPNITQGELAREVKRRLQKDFGGLINATQ